jgi:hypothetical protein
MKNPLKILIKFPTRGRPDKFLRVLNLYYTKATNKENLAFLISCDEDDKSMNNPEMIKKLEIAKKKINLFYFFGNSKTKIEAVNADMDKIDGWDILLLASDDMIPVVDGYDEIIRNDMYYYHRNMDGVLWYNDGGQNKINTLSILGNRYYKRFNYIYHPDYTSLWCDNEFTDVSVFLGKVYKSDQTIIEHVHPAFNKTNFDELYVKNESFFNHDKAVYERRSQKNFDLNNVLPYLSILTPSVPSRVSGSLSKLMSKIEDQIKKNNLETKVEHLVLIDNKVRTVGRKRDNLVQSAVGQFVAFVDDDDDISDDYVLELTNAIKNNPDVDVITFKQNCFIENNPKSVVVFGLENENEGYVPNTIFKRKPYHVCAWNRKIAQKYRVPSNNICEDVGWCSQMWKEAKTEFFIDKPLHAYVHAVSHTECLQTGENSVYNNKQI